MRASNLGVRIATSVVGVPLLLCVLLWGSSWAWYAVVMAAVGVAAAELFAMTHRGDRVAQAIGVASSLVVSLTVYYFGHSPAALSALLLGLPLVGILVPLWRLGEIRTAALRMMAGTAAPLYLGGLLTTLALLRRDFGPDGRGYVLLSLALAWLGDTGGYFFGRRWGKTRLYPEVSPAKTWFGLVGVMTGALVSALVIRSWLLAQLPLWHLLPLALVAGIVGQLGDLAESLLKRSTGIKDSGWILPGHGGLLDRIDALLLVSPVIYAYACWIASG